ncbi:hypothetical protein PILCRDRAFT_814750, partial [Piloderma croceum F 1598]
VCPKHHHISSWQASEIGGREMQLGQIRMAPRYSNTNGGLYRASWNYKHRIEGIRHTACSFHEDARLNYDREKFLC